MSSLKEIKGFLDGLLRAGQYDDVAPYFAKGASHLVRGEPAKVRCLGLALDAAQGLYPWVGEHAVDALLLHRPWAFQASRLPETPVLAYHLAFDESLTVGYNPYLADALSLTDLQEFGYKQGRPIGMIGRVVATPFSNLHARVQAVFGGVERARAVTTEVTRMAVVGAMTKRLVREAAEQGVTLYLTGQWRAHAEKAVAASDMGVITVGHERSELWGLKVLAQTLEQQFPELETVVLEPK